MKKAFLFLCLFGFTVWFDAETNTGLVWVNDASGNAVIIENPGNNCSVVAPWGNRTYKCSELKAVLKDRQPFDSVVGVILPAGKEKK
ncbi:MAG: hypothetical protein ABIN58_06215 [candidate division WOR-3 bacterium]